MLLEDSFQLSLQFNLNRNKSRKRQRKAKSPRLLRLLLLTLILTCRTLTPLSTLSLKVLKRMRVVKRIPKTPYKEDCLWQLKTQMKPWKNSNKTKRKRLLILLANKFKRLKWEEDGTSGLGKQLTVVLTYSKRNDLPRDNLALKSSERRKSTNLNRRESMANLKEFKSMMALALMVRNVTWNLRLNTWWGSYLHNSSQVNSLTPWCLCQLERSGTHRRVTNASFKMMC